MEAIAYLLTRLAPSLMEWGIMLLPLAIYLLWLGFAPGRSKHPVVLSGARDTLILVLALSGFLLIGPPTWILERFSRSGWKSYVLAYLVYLLCVVSLVWAWVSSRRQSLIVYSLRPDAFPAILRSILEELQLPHTVTPGRIAVDGHRLVINLDASATMYCLTVSWQGDAQLWRQVDAQLRAKLLAVETTDNPAGAILPLWGGLMLLFATLSAVIFGWYWAYISL